jgi:tetratricopeptide (TPR) repeat protein
MDKHSGPDTVAPEAIATPPEPESPSPDSLDCPQPHFEEVHHALKPDASPLITTWDWWKCALIIAGITTLVYFNSFEGQFVFDDRIYIDDPSIRTLLPPWQVMFSSGMVSRPLIGLSLAINYAISKEYIWSYHAFNLLIHVCAALTLFGIVRRTLLTAKLKEQWGQYASILGLTVALIWAVHPLQTQSVTYIIQRCESVMGLFFLLTLYCSIRSFETTRKGWWQLAAISACAAGMFAKQVMVMAPLLVLLYDFMFVADSLKESLRKRRGFYALLATTWLLLVLTTKLAPVNQTAGFAVKSITPLNYFFSEFAVIVHYLRLAVWPTALSIDYGWTKAETIAQTLPYGLMLLALGLPTVWAIIRRHPLGYLGAWFFGILSITSSFMPFDDLAFEHRMYLPLAAVVSLVVVGVFFAFVRSQKWLAINHPQYQSAGQTATVMLLTLVVVALGFLTVRRNIDYSSELVLWADTLSKCPQNPRAHNNYGLAVAKRGNHDEGMAHFQEALKYKPDFAEAYTNLGLGYYLKDNLEEAKINLLEAIRLDPKQSTAHDVLGKVLSEQGKVDEAIAEFTKALALKERGETFYELAKMFHQKGEEGQAIDNCDRALRMKPDWASPYNGLALIFTNSKDPKIKNRAQALACAQKAVALTNAQDPESLETLAIVYAQDGHFSEAVVTLQKAHQLTVVSGNQAKGATLAARLKDYQLKIVQP